MQTHLRTLGTAHPPGRPATASAHRPQSVGWWVFCLFFVFPGVCAICGCAWGLLPPVREGAGASRLEKQGWCFVFGAATPCDVQGSLLAVLHSGIVPGQLGNRMGCWGLNLGSQRARQVIFPAMYVFGFIVAKLLSPELQGLLVSHSHVPRERCLTLQG